MSDAGGGVCGIDLTRSFLDTTPPHLQTGWPLVARNSRPVLRA